MFPDPKDRKSRDSVIDLTKLRKLARNLFVLLGKP